MRTLLGTTLSGRYRLESRIGSGGMSIVYRAHDETLDRFVAIKVLHREVSSDSAALERFRREARAVARLSHPNIVQVIDAGEDDGRPYIVFECVDGETLKERIREQGRLGVPEAVGHAAAIARALGAAHAQQVVHRDVKPQNVLIDADDTAKVTDFGIARTLDEEGLTADGRVLGTTDYVSPEQALGHEVTGQSDLYALGVVLYEMLTGELPYRGDSQVAVAMQHVRGTVPDVRATRPEVPPALAAVIKRATARQPARRYPDGAVMAAELERALVLDDGPGRDDGMVTAQIPAVAAPAVIRPGHSRRRRRLAAGAAVALIAAGAAAAALLAGSAARPGQRLGGAVPVALCGTCASAYNPDSTAGGTAQNNDLAHLAVDGKASTAWATQTYYDYALGKPGVGIYVRTAAPVAATELRLDTATPGFHATVYATNQTPDPNSFALSDWTALTPSLAVKGTQTSALATAGRRYRYYLLWITLLPPRLRYALVNEIYLFR